MAVANTITEPDEQPRALRAPEVGVELARLIGLPRPIKPATIFKWIRLGALGSIHLGRRVWVQRSEIERFVAEGGYQSARPPKSSGKSRGDAR